MQESCSRLLVSTQIRQECSWRMEKEVPVYLLGGRKKTQNERVWTADEVLHPSEVNASQRAANGNEADPSRTHLNFPAVWLASRSVTWVLTFMRHRSLSITHAASHACSVIPCHTHTLKQADWEADTWSQRAGVLLQAKRHITILQQLSTAGCSLPWILSKD